MSCYSVRLYCFAKIHQSLRNSKKKVLFFCFAYILCIIRTLFLLHIVLKNIFFEQYETNGNITVTFFDKSIGK